MRKVNEDDRRILYETDIEGDWKVIKLLDIKLEDSEVGNHYHKEKDELFILISGRGIFSVGYSTTVAKAPHTVFVPHGVKHTFRLSKGSKLVCLCSRQHDDNDDFI